MTPVPATGIVGFIIPPSSPPQAAMIAALAKSTALVIR